MLPRTLVGCSSKSYFGARQAAAWGPDVVDGVADDPAGTDGLFICPSFPLIPTLLQGFAAAGGLVGAQDVSVHPRGPYTGEPAGRTEGLLQHGDERVGRADEQPVRARGVVGHAVDDVGPPPRGLLGVEVALRTAADECRRKRGAR